MLKLISYIMELNRQHGMQSILNSLFSIIFDYQYDKEFIKVEGR